MKKPTPFGKYFLFDRFSAGGMAEIFRAKTVTLEGSERIVAVKKMLDLLTADKDLTSMFIDEAKLAVQLNHPGICQVVDWGKVGDSYFIAMEYVQGQDLRRMFQQCKQQLPDGTATMPLAQSCFIVMKLCEALDYAHNKQDSLGKPLNVVHRDVSPANVLVSYDGEIKLIDFGIAKNAATRETEAESVKGKFAYMSPEQARGEALDRRSDVFSTGIVLHELLTGERLFPPDQEMAMLEKIKNAEVLPPTAYNRKIPEELDRIVLKALAAKPEDRYQTAIDLHTELQSFLYTSGEFFSRKDLAAWIKRVFRTEMEAEQAELDAVREAKVSFPASGADSLQRARATLSLAALKADPGGGLRPSKETGSIMAVKSTGTMKAFSVEAAKPASAEPGRPTPDSGIPNEWMSTNARTVKTASAPPQPIAANRADLAVKKLKPVSTRVNEMMPDEDTAVDGPLGAGKLAEPRFEDDNLATKAFPQQDRAVLDGLVAAKTGGVVQPRDAGDIETQQYKTVDDNDNERDPLEGGPTVAQPFEKANVPRTIEEILEVSSPVMLERSEPAMPMRPAALPSVAFPPPLELPDPLEVSRRNLEQQKNQSVSAVTLLLGFLLLAICGAGAAYWLLLRPGTVVVAVNPGSDLAISVDDKPIPAMTTAPVLLNLSPGTHKVAIEHTGYKAWVEIVTVEPGETLRMTAPLTAQVQAMGSFTLLTEPPGAMVFLDGASLGQVTPLRVPSVKAGSHTLEMRLGTRALSQTIAIEAGKTHDFSFMLPAETASGLPSGPEKGPNQGTAIVDKGVAIPDKGVAIPDKGAAIQNKGAAIQNKGVAIPDKDVAIPDKDVAIPDKGAAIQNKGAAIPDKGAAIQNKGAAIPDKGAAIPDKGAAIPDKGAAIPDKVVAIPEKGAAIQHKAATVPEKKPLEKQPEKRVAVQPERHTPRPLLRVGTPKPAANVGLLRINSKPWTRIFVDGQDTGLTTPQTAYQMTPGMHQIMLFNSDFGIRETFAVHIIAGETQTVIKDFRK